MIKNCKRISIIGGSGTGKTTLSNNLSKILNLPAYHIDGMNYSDNWQERSYEERDNIILNKIKEEKWIIDGTYRTTLNQRVNASDLVIYLDYSSFTQLKSVLIRFLKNHGKEKLEIPGCKERISWDFLRFVWNWRKNKRDHVISIISQIDDNKKIIFKNRKQLNKWFENEFNTKIIV